MKNSKKVDGKRRKKRTGPDIIDLSIFHFRFLVGVDFSSFFSFFSFTFAKRMMTDQHAASTVRHAKTVRYKLTSIFGSVGDLFVKVVCFMLRSKNKCKLQFLQ